MESSLNFAGMQPVAPVRPVAPYIGGKRILSGTLCARIDATEHRTYVEPFVGMGGVFLRRTRQAKVEVINDLSGDVATLYRVLQRLYPYFMDMLRWRITSRAEFKRLLDTPVHTLLDIERAARFLYLQRVAFGGKVSGRNFGVSKTTPGRFDVTKLEPLLADLHDRLAGVVIECLPYADVIARYDSSGTLFYLDPPYVNCEGDYGVGMFEPQDFERLASQLAAISGRFILSINDTPMIRDVFSAFAIEPVSLTYRVSGHPTPARELIITSPI